MPTPAYLTLVGKSQGLISAVDVGAGLNVG